MSHLTIVAAMDAYNGIGKDNTLAWHIPEDMAHFKAVTIGKPVIMGRKTFTSIGKALSGRRNIVVSRNPDFRAEDCEVVGSLDAAIVLIGDTPACVIGGGELYAQAIHKADVMIITEVYQAFDCDVTFPRINLMRWQEMDRSFHQSKNGMLYDIVTYHRIP